MSDVDRYLNAAVRDNTRRSYANAVRHFEVEWGGLLPASPQVVARYLAENAGKFAPNTLRHRLAAIANWHVQQGFVDPTRAQIVRQVLKGIRTVHTAKVRQAKPLQIDELTRMDNAICADISVARARSDRAALLRNLRDRSFLLLGFWRGFRTDDMLGLRVENVTVVPGEGLHLYLPRSKTDREATGRQFKVPALSRLCPMTAFREWVAEAGLEEGPVFRRIDRWGHVGEEALHPNSVIALLRSLFSRAGIALPKEYSGHSLRRGFAGWAAANGWNLKALMEYVGWKDVRSAMRYLDDPDATLRDRFEAGLAETQTRGSDVAQPRKDQTDLIELEVHVVLARFGRSLGNPKRARDLIEKTCLERHSVARGGSSDYRIFLNPDEVADLDEFVYALLDDMHRIAENQQCFLEAQIRQPSTDATWD